MPGLAKHEEVREYYGRVLKGQQSLKTNACCPIESVPAEHRDILEHIHPEILDKFYGCGSPIPPLLGGRVVLDLGCGTGRDVFVASALAGADGLVIGVDMTEEQLAVAANRAEEQAALFGFAKPNVSFRRGFIEDLAGVGIEDDSVDVVISNCVINLTPNKDKAFKEAYRVLKSGGRIMISDIVLLKELPDFIKNSDEAYTACVAGASLKDDYMAIIKAAGFHDIEIVDESSFSLDCCGNDPLVQPILENWGVSSDQVKEAANSVVSIKVSAIK